MYVFLYLFCVLFYHVTQCGTSTVTFFLLFVLPSSDQKCLLICIVTSFTSFWPSSMFYNILAIYQRKGRYSTEIRCINVYYPIKKFFAGKSGPIDSVIWLRSAVLDTFHVTPNFFFLRIRSRLWQGHLRPFHSFFSRSSLADLLIFLGSLSHYKVYFGLTFNFLTNGLTLSATILSLTFPESFSIPILKLSQTPLALSVHENIPKDHPKLQLTLIQAWMALGPRYNQDWAQQETI